MMETNKMNSVKEMLIYQMAGGVTLNLIYLVIAATDVKSRKKAVKKPRYGK